MIDSVLNRKKQIRAELVLFVTMMLFKFACDLSFYKILSLDISTFSFDFSELKYVNGLFCCIILFFGIRHEKHRVSVFMLYLVYLVQIIPITTIYAFRNENAIYYNTVCISFFICELLVQRVNIRNKPHFKRSKNISNLIIASFWSVIIGLIIYIVWKNGMFTLTALNIYKVYELRRSGSFVIGRYMQYLFNWVMAAVIPFLIAKKTDDRNYFIVFILCAVVLIAYLYSGFKSYLFYLPMILISSVWARRENFYNEIFSSASAAFFVLVIFACFSPVFEIFFTRLYSLFGSRLLMVPANNKFSYYDFFSKNPKMGLGAIFPRWLIKIPNHYENIRYTFLISELYYGEPEMNSNTGFLAEGYMRFGHIGILLILILFAVVLRMMDNMQKRAGYAFTIGAFVYPVLGLTDAHLLDSIFFGPWMIIMLLLVAYTSKGEIRC